MVRPGYTTEALDTILRVARITDGSTVIDMAAGTGKFTAELARRSKCHIVAVEPSPGMLSTLRTNLPNVETIEATAFSVPQLPDGTADAIVVAQAFHWFANRDALTEFRRLLKPNTGKLVLAWNYEDFDALSPDSWQSRSVKLFHSLDKGVPQYNHMKWPAAFEEKPQVFGKIHEIKIPYDKIVPSREFYWEYWQSRSYVTALSDQQRIDIKRELDNILDTSLRPEDIGPRGEFIAKRGTHIVLMEPL